VGERARDIARKRGSGREGNFFVSVRVCECLSVLCVCVCVIERYTESETGTGKSTQQQIGCNR